MAKVKPVLTTGEIAKICNVAPRTVSKWFDSGQLRGYRIPGSRDRRVPLEQLVRFMRAHAIPLNGLEVAVSRVVIACGDAEFSRTLADALTGNGQHEARLAGSVFELLACGTFRPRAALVDVSLPGFSARDFFRAFAEQPDAPAVAAIAILQADNEVDRRKCLDAGFASCLVKPFDAAAARDALDRACVAATE
ncbi:MAG: helix-turn-helix domain-containing protein [Phycisphaerae bacterium]